MSPCRMEFISPPHATMAALGSFPGLRRSVARRERRDFGIRIPIEQGFESMPRERGTVGQVFLRIGRQNAPMGTI